MQESTISGALCDVMAQALIEKGIDADLARTLAERACQPVRNFPLLFPSHDRMVHASLRYQLHQPSQRQR